MASYPYQGRNTKTFQKLPGYRNLAAWQAASDLTMLVTAFTARLDPAQRRLSNQLHGAALSAGGYIAEGYCSGTLADYIRFCHRACGSLGEVGSYLQDCERDGLLAGAELEAMLKQYGDATTFLERLTQTLLTKADSEPTELLYGMLEASDDDDLPQLGDRSGADLDAWLAPDPRSPSAEVPGSAA